MKTTILFCALLLATATTAFAEEDSNYQKAVKLKALEQADDDNVEAATKLHIGRNADEEDVKKAVKIKAIDEARD